MQLDAEETELGAIERDIEKMIAHVEKAEERKSKKWNDDAERVNKEMEKWGRDEN